MKKNPTLFVMLGLLLLITGVFLSFTGGPPPANPTLAQQCQQKLRSEGADTAMIAQCADRAFAVQMTATNAVDAAREISAVNDREIGGNAIAKLLMGIGIALAIGGLVIRSHLRKAMRSL